MKCTIFQSRMISFAVTGSLFISLFTVSGISKELDVKNIALVLQRQDSMIRSVRYQMIQVKNDFVEGRKILAFLKPELIIPKSDKQDVIVVKKKYIRIQEGEKDFIHETLYDDGFKTIKSEYLFAWDGFSGRMYWPQENRGRIIEKLPTIDMDTFEVIGLDILGKKLYEWLLERADEIHISESREGIFIEFTKNKYLSLRYLLLSDQGFMPKRFEILKAGAVMRKVVVEEYVKSIIDGVDVFFPKEINTTQYIFKESRPKRGKIPETVPLLEAKIKVTDFAFNEPVSDDQFEIRFPVGTIIYDELFEEHLSEIDYWENLEEDINETASE